MPERDADHRSQGTCIERVALDDDDGPPESRLRPGGRAEVGPPDLPLGDHHSVAPKIPRAAAAVTASASGGPICSRTASRPAVTSSGA